MKFWKTVHKLQFFDTEAGIVSGTMSVPSNGHIGYHDGSMRVS